MSFLFPRKRVLLAGNEGIALFGPTSNNGIEREIALAWEVPNFNQQLTAALLKQNQNNPVLVLFDADHAYRKGEDMPKLSFFDRSLFIKRKLDQAFPNYPVRASFEVAAAKRKGEAKEPSSYLFVAISETDRLDKIANSILEAGVPVAGLGLLPVESEGLVTALSSALFGHKGKKSQWAVLIGQHETGGLRQVVVKDGHLALTRMTPVSEAGLQGAGWVEEVMREFKATLTYIARFGYTPGEGLDVIVIGGEIEKNFFEQQKFLPGSNFQCLKVEDALRAIGMRGLVTHAGNFGDAVHAGWASRKKFLAASVKVESIFKIQMPRLAARVASMALVASMIFMLGMTLVANQDYGPLKEKVEQRQSQKKLLALEYEQESKVFDGFPVKPETIRGTLAVKKALDGSKVDMGANLEQLRQSVDADIRIEELTFNYEPTSLPETVEAQRKLGDSSDRGKVKILLRISIPGNVSLEQKATRAERLVTQMTQVFKDYNVYLKSQFGNVSKGGSFSGEVGGEEKPLQNAAATAEIELQGVPL